MTYFTDEQVELLLKPIHPRRVRVRDGMSHVEGYDIRAELTRVFGFGRWTSEILEQAVLCERETRTKTYADKKTGEQKGGNPAWYVVYRSRVRLTVFAPDGTLIAFHDGSHVGESTHPVFGEAHGNALTNSETYALRRAAINLGDQFGLSLYNKGSLDAIVRWTLVRPEAGTEAASADTDDVPQVSAEQQGPASGTSDEDDAGSAFDDAQASEPVRQGPRQDIPPDDTWQTPAAQETPDWSRWLTGAMTMASSHASLDACRAAWARGSELVAEGKLPKAEVGKLQALLTKRMTELKATGGKAVPGLAAGDPWHDTIEGLSDVTEAETLLADAEAQLRDEKIEPARFEQIEAAVRVRFPGAGAVAA